MYDIPDNVHELAKSVQSDIVKFRKTRTALRKHSSMVIYNTFSFMFNCPTSFIEQCWDDDAHMRDHLHTVWISLNKKRALKVSDIDLLVMFFQKLDSVNRDKFCDYILNWQLAQRK